MRVVILLAVVVCFCAGQFCYPDQCTSDTDCGSSGLCCDGKCIKLGQTDNIGSPCSTSDTCLGKCGTSLACTNSVCALKKKAPSCSCDTDGDCDVFCRSDKTCAYHPLVNGEVCLDSRECLSGICTSRQCIGANLGQKCVNMPKQAQDYINNYYYKGGGCAVGLSCVANVCVSTIPEGGTCTFGPNGENPCMEGFNCVQRKCMPLFQDAGGLCNPYIDNACKEGLFCKQENTDGPSYVYSNYTCFPKTSTGGACSRTEECEVGLKCSDVCKVALGELCSSKSDCGSGQECNCDSKRCTVPSEGKMQVITKCVDENNVGLLYRSPFSLSAEEQRAFADLFCCLASFSSEYCPDPFPGFNVDCATSTFIPFDPLDRCSKDKSAIGGFLNCDKARPTRSTLSASPTVEPSRVGSLLCVTLGAAVLTLFL